VLGAPLLLKECSQHLVSTAALDVTLARSEVESPLEGADAFVLGQAQAAGASVPMRMLARPRLEIPVLARVHDVGGAVVARNDYSTVLHKKISVPNTVWNAVMPAIRKR
jgi:hypothetical protein